MTSRPTIIDVAHHAGVSKTTVSRVINGHTDKVGEETCKRVKEAIESLGYEYNAIASSLRTMRTMVVMLMIPDITNPFWPAVARGIQDTMDDAGYSVVFANNDWNQTREQSFIQLAMRTRVDGILINPIHITEEHILKTGIPSVILGIRSGFHKTDMVGSDTNNGIKMAIDYLHRLGHHRIGFLMGKSEISSSSSRLQTFSKLIKAKGLPFSRDLIVEVTFDNYGGMQGMNQLLQLSEIPTAVLASNDLIALGAVKFASDMGLKIPEDISIMGIDDIDAASLLVPPLTTMRKQKYKIGCKSAELLLRQLSHQREKQPEVVKFPCQLEVRGSTKSID